MDIEPEPDREPRPTAEARGNANTSIMIVDRRASERLLRGLNAPRDPRLDEFVSKDTIWDR